MRDIRGAQIFLNRLTELVPPPDGEHHGLLVLHDGEIQLALRVNGGCQPVNFTADDLEEDPLVLAANVATVLNLPQEEEQQEVLRELHTLGDFFRSARSFLEAQAVPVGLKNLEAILKLKLPVVYQMTFLGRASREDFFFMGLHRDQDIVGWFRDSDPRRLTEWALEAEKASNTSWGQDWKTLFRVLAGEKLGVSEV